MIERLMGLLDANHPFYEFMKKMFWVLLLSLLYIVTSIPVITIGATTTAMFSVLQKLISNKKIELLSDYFSSFKRNFVKATLMWLVILPIVLLCYFDLTFFIAMHKSFGAVGYVMLAVAIIVTIGIAMFVLIMYPILAEFEGSIRDTLSVGIYIVKKHILKCFMAVISTIVIMGFAICVIIYREFLFVYFPLISFGVNAFVLTYIYDSVLRPYYEEDSELEEYNGEE